MDASRPDTINSDANGFFDRGPSRRSQRLEQWGVAVALMLFVVLGLWYSLVVPPFETPDEPFHYAFSKHIAEGNGLPVQSLQSTGPWHQEGSQAPLFYLLTGWLTAGIDQSDFEALSTRNQGANIGDPLFPGNKNYMRYSAAGHPLAGSNLALHIGRWLSLALGVVTLVAIYATARLLFGDDDCRTYALPLAALWIAATIPQYAFISASFSNDSMVIAASAVTVWWLLRLAVRPVDRVIRWWELVMLGLLLGIAALSKLQGLGLAVLIAATGLWMVWRRRDWKLLMQAMLLVSLPALVIAGWWYWRNNALYGDWFGLSNLLAINGQRERPLSWRGFVGEFRGLRYSFWGLFGWFNILLPTWLYRLFDLLTVASLIGVVGVIVTSLRTDRQRRSLNLAALVVLALWASLSFGLWFYWTSQATGSQGRLLYPGLVAFTPLLTAGLWWWVRLLPRRLQPIPWVSLIVLLLTVSLYTLVVLLPGAYNQPRPVADIPEEAQPVDIVYGDTDHLSLLALELPDDQRFGFGQEVPVKLYLQANEAVRDDYRLFIQLLDETGSEIANVTSHPGWGRNPTTLWEAGAIYADEYRVRIVRTIDDRSPLLADLYVGFVNPQKENENKLPVTARDRDGEEVVPFLAQVAVEQMHPPTIEEYGLTSSDAAFGDVMKLVGYDVDAQPSLDSTESLTVTLLWEATGTPAADYTIFAHLLSAEGDRIAGYDRAPAADRFPTGHWRTDDRILSRLPLPMTGVPPGDYTLWVGIYESDSEGAVRLPVSHGNGFEVGDGQILLDEVTITN